MASLVSMTMLLGYSAAAFSHVLFLQPRISSLTRSSLVTAVSKDETFSRARLLTFMDGPGMQGAVTAQDVVNVLGRWNTHTDWDTIGELVAIDKLFDKNWQPLKPLPVLSPSFYNSRRVSNSAASSKSAIEYAKAVEEASAQGRLVKAENKKYKVMERSDPRPTPQRRGFCKRNDLVQRYWHNQNVPKLKFKNKAMAASIGCTVREMDELPINPLALEVVFDALSESQSGITEREMCNKRRAGYENADGSFNAEAFRSDLRSARGNIIKAYSFFPGTPFLISNIVYFQVDGWGKTLEYIESNQEKLAENARLWSEAFTS